MKPKVTLLILVAITVAAVISAVAINRQIRGSQSNLSQTRQFSVKGVVRGVDAENKTLRVEHEEIPGYMPAMTMPLIVKETALLKGLQAGDSIQFALAVTEDDSWISEVERIEGKPAEGTFALQKSSSSSTRETERLTIGETVPDFALTDQNGQRIQLSNFKGKAVVVTFIYTRCPLPNFCPLMSKNFSSLQERLTTEFRNKFQLLSVSIDPQFDTPAVLKNYSGIWNKDEKTWSFLSGSAEEIENVGSLFGLVYERTGPLINHDLRTALIGPDGKLVHVWKSNVWTPYEVQRMVRETLIGKRDI